MREFSIAYLHTLLSLRLPSLSPTHLASQNLSAVDVQSEFGQLVPFVVESKSTVRFETARDAWASVWEAIGREAVRYKCLCTRP